MDEICYIIKKFKNQSETKERLIEYETTIISSSNYIIKTPVNLDNDRWWVCEISCLNKYRKKLYTDYFDMNGKFIKREDSSDWTNKGKCGGKYKQGLVSERRYVRETSN